MGHDQIQKIAVCSVVPDWNYSLNSACLKYFNIPPFFLQAGVKTGLQIKYRNPLEVGADRIANAIAAVHLYPNQNIIVIDFGTTTTFCAISEKKEYLGGVIVPGVRISMEVLEKKTAKLPKVEIIKPNGCLGRSTVESIQSGLYFGQVAIMEKLKMEITRECFPVKNPVVLGTGGFVRFFQETGVFDQIIPELVLQGLYLVAQKNHEGKSDDD